MRVKYLESMDNRYWMFHVVIPEDKEIEDLPTQTQDLINALGELDIICTEDLSDKNDGDSLTIKKQIPKTGVCLIENKLSCGFNEIKIRRTFPPISVLKKLSEM